MSNKVRERILAMGHPGSGKSYQWLKIAEAVKPTGAKFRCIDTDDAISYMLHTQFPHLLPENGGNVFVYSTYDWPQYREALAAIMKDEKEDDWAIVDMCDNAWSAVQKYFVSEVFSQGKGEYFLQARKMLKERGDLDQKGKTAKSVMPDAFKGWVDWPVVNSLYDDWISPLVYRMKSHLYVTTKPQRVETDDSPDTKLVFGSLGVRPAGQKNLGHQVHTVFLFGMDFGTDKSRNWHITTAKDRANRTYFKNSKLTSLYGQYLVGKAGWEMI